jgi:response regulator RpfG family c-di-GMP phosphodiesterase
LVTKSTKAVFLELTIGATMNKKEQMNFNLNSFLLSISNILEYQKIKLINKKPNHIKRVIFIGLHIAIKLQLKPKEISDLCSFIILSNNGLMQSSWSGDNINSKLELEISQNNIKDLSLPKDIIKFTQENYDGSGIFGVKANQIPILSQIVSFSYQIETLFSSNLCDLDNKQNIIEFVNKNKNSLFSKDISDAFLEVSSIFNFWQEILDEQEILKFIYGSIEDFTYQPTFKEVLKITSFIDKLTSKRFEHKSIYTNSFRVPCEIMSEFYGFEHKDKNIFLISSDLRNLNHLLLSCELLSKENLTKYDLELVGFSLYASHKALAQVIGFDNIAKLATVHNEKLDGSGYPNQFESSQLSLKDRLMINLNIYQNLREKQAYREEMSHEKAIVTMQTLTYNNRIDKSILKDIDINLKNVEYR